MKKAIVIGLVLMSVAGANKPNFEFVKYSDTGNNHNGEIIGVRITKGIREFTDLQGNKEYYIAGKYLKEIVEEYNKNQ